jgi:hypothetical protein
VPRSGQPKPKLKRSHWDPTLLALLFATRPERPNAKMQKKVLKTWKLDPKNPLHPCGATKKTHIDPVEITCISHAPVEP